MNWKRECLPAHGLLHPGRVRGPRRPRPRRGMAWQRVQTALAAQRLGLRLADDFADVGYLGMSMTVPV